MPFIQRKCACGGGCPRCKHADQRQASTKLAVNSPGDQFEQEADRVAKAITGTASSGVPVPIRRIAAPAPSSGDHDDAPSLVSQVLQQPGRPLDSNTRTFMETRLGHNLERVRIHDDAGAADSARSVGALAYTAGRHIVFGEGQHDSGSHAGRLLLAHELAHTIQQDGSATPRVMRQAQPAFGSSCSGGAKDPCQAARCTPSNHTTARADFTRAISYVNTAIAALSANPLSTDTIRALDWYFADHESATVNDVKTRLGCILGCLNDTRTNNRYGCHPDDSSLAYVCTPDTTPICGNSLDDVCLTNKHFASDERERAEIVIHECAHRAGMSLGSPNSVPDMYRFTARFMNLSTADALQNSDSFAMFAGAITGGVRLSVVPLFSAGGGLAFPGGQSTWQFRLYGGAEFQHPVLHIFNPTIGLSLSFIGDPTTPAPGRISSPTMVASLLAGFRLANPRPGGAGGFYGSIYGGPSAAVSLGTGIGAEAGVGLGYRWRWLDVSAGATYFYDPTRAAGSQNIFGGTVNLGIIPKF
jgi:hypothetical protein